MWFKSTVLSAFKPGGNTSFANWLLVGEGEVSTTMRLSNEVGYVNANVIAVFAPILFANRTTLESCSSWIRWYTSKAIREKLMWELRSLSPWFLASTVTICNRTVFNLSLVVPKQLLWPITIDLKTIWPMITVLVGWALFSITSFGIAWPSSTPRNCLLQSYRSCDWQNGRKSASFKDWFRRCHFSLV